MTDIKPSPVDPEDRNTPENYLALALKHAADRDRAVRERDDMTQRFNLLRADRDAVARERDALRETVAKHAADRDHAVRERSAAQRERDAAQRERDAAQRERDAATEHVRLARQDLREIQSAAQQADHHVVPRETAGRLLSLVAVALARPTPTHLMPHEDQKTAFAVANIYRDQAYALRDLLEKERADALRERDALRGTVAKHAADRDHAVRERDAARAEATRQTQMRLDCIANPPVSIAPSHETLHRVADCLAKAKAVLEPWPLTPRQAELAGVIREALALLHQAPMTATESELSRARRDVEELRRKLAAWKPVVTAAHQFADAVCGNYRRNAAFEEAAMAAEALLDAVRAHRRSQHADSPEAKTLAEMAKALERLPDLSTASGVFYQVRGPAQKPLPGDAEQIAANLSDWAATNAPKLTTDGVRLAALLEQWRAGKTLAAGIEAAMRAIVGRVPEGGTLWLVRRALDDYGERVKAAQ